MIPWPPQVVALYVAALRSVRGAARPEETPLPLFGVVVVGGLALYALVAYVIARCSR